MLLLLRLSVFDTQEKYFFYQLSLFRNVKNITKLGEQELARNSKSSWHDKYKDSAWIFVGGLPYDLTEGDIITVFSQ